MSLFLWSWVVTLPVTLIGGYWVFSTVERFHTYKVRYNPVNKSELDFGNIARYEIARLVQRIRVGVANNFRHNETNLKRVHLLLSESEVARLEAHMPQSGFEYVKGRLLIDGKIEKANVKYRGDTFYRWAWDKKSMRIKTTKSNLLDGLRYSNLLAPRTVEQLNNHLSYRLANIMSLVAPATEIVRLFVNGEDRGVYIKVEQINELTLRRNRLMPGDIYRGEIIGKDKFRGSNIKSLFDSPAVWDKVAINNHFDEHDIAPLTQLIDLVNRGSDPNAQAKLSEIMDMTVWGRYSAYETLTQSTHADDVHNWRLYYDPWRGKFLPVIWDTMGWHDQLRRASYKPEIIASSLMKVMFNNGDFIRARSLALKHFFDSGKDQLFLREVRQTIQSMEKEIVSDPFLNPPDPDEVKHHMSRLEQVIADVFEKNKWFLFEGGTDITDYGYYVLHNPDIKAAWQNSGEDLFSWGEAHWHTVGRKENRPDNPAIPHLRYTYARHTFELSVASKHPLGILKLEYDRSITTKPRVKASFTTAKGEVFVDISGAVKTEGNVLYLNAGFLPNVTTAPINNRHDRVVWAPGYYRIEFIGLDPNQQLTTLTVQRSEKWLRAVEVKAMDQNVFDNLYAPIAAQPVQEPEIWAGDVTLTGHNTMQNPLVIKPGTTVRLAPGATLILKDRLTAVGTPEAPIQFLPMQKDQAPWGAIVLQGHGADGTQLAHCKLSGGSGSKGNLFEYSGMLSIHNVKDVHIGNCRFENNSVVDDMLHTVYSEIQLEGVRFENAFSDAVDFDISNAQITDSYFQGSGNDAVDLMTSEAVITGTVFKSNGDKGISVGENSRLFGANNRLVDNNIGIQSKDRSSVVLFNHSFVDNKTALHAYKKNWRYGEGGKIFIAKSVIVGGEVTAQAQKRSSIVLFDTYVDTQAKGKRISTVSVDDLSSKSASRSTLIPKVDERGGGYDFESIKIPEQLRQQIHVGRRGDYISG
jgi:hypothetical protein